MKGTKETKTTKTTVDMSNDAIITKKYGNLVDPVPTIPKLSTIDGFMGDYQLLDYDLAEYAATYELDVVIIDEVDFENIILIENDRIKHILVDDVRPGMTVELRSRADGTEVRAEIEDVSVYDDELYIVTKQGKFITTYDFPGHCQV